MTTIEQSYRSVVGRILLLSTALFLVGTNAFVIAGVLPAIAETLDAETGQVSLAITAYSAVVAIASPALAILLPRVPRTRLMVIGLVLIAAGTALAALSVTLPMFFAGRIVAALGGAALVPVATATAVAIAPPAHRARAIALTALGFTASTAVGSPLGTALGAVGGWQIPLLAVGALAAVLAIAVGLRVRGVPLPPVVSLRHRFSPLANPRILSVIATQVFVVAGFNLVYIFSSVVTREATGGDGTLLAMLLMVYGVAGIAGNLVFGRLTDRIGSRLAASLLLGSHALVLLVMPFVEASFIGIAAVFALWGLVAFGASIPVQDRLVQIEPETAGVALSWFTTALYLGVAIAPPLGTAALAAGGAHLIPLVGAACTLLAFLAFQLGFLRRRSGSMLSAAERAQV